MHVVLRDAELLEVAAHRFPGDACLAQRCDGRARRALGELLAVFAEDQSVVDELGRRRAERLEEPAVQLLVRPVVEAADDVRDAEVRVVDDAREVVGRGAVLAQQRDSVEALAQLRAGLAVALLPLALADRAVLPGEPEPLEVADDLLFSARHVSLRIGVVDPEQHPVAETAVGDGAEGVTDVQGAGRTGCEADSLHRGPSLRAASTAPTG